MKTCKRWRDEVKEDMNVMGIKNRQAMARDYQEWRKIVWEAKVQNGLQCSRRRVVCNTNKNNIILMGISELQSAQNCLNHWGYRIAEGPLYLEVLLIRGCRNGSEALMLVVFVLACCSSSILMFLQYQSITGLIHSFMGTILFLNCHSFITLDLPCVGKWILNPPSSTGLVTIFITPE